ncbi:MAG: hypothetical protein GY795_06275 [Desulfobacterales bacterium]|nr:hypothetical protein [Desulfobacterales bacterium]
MVKMKDKFTYEKNHYKIVAISDGRVLGVRENGGDSINVPIEAVTEKVLRYFILDEDDGYPD